MLCLECRSENLDHRTICVTCGASLSRECASCGFANRLEAKFCGGCGGALLALSDGIDREVGAPVGGADAAFNQVNLWMPRSPTSFVGREAPIGILARALADSRAGIGQACVVTGLPGAGKSRLVQEFLATHVDDDWRVLGVRAIPQGRDIPCYPIARLLRAWAGIEDRDLQSDIVAKLHAHIERLGDDLIPFLPALHALLDLPVQDAVWAAIEPFERRKRVIAAVNALILRAAELPTVVIVEDMQWADSEMQAVVDALFDRLPKARLLLIVTCREDWTPDWLALHNYIGCRADPLSPAESERLLDGLLGGDADLESLRRGLIENAAGVPLYFEEAVRTLLDTGDLSGRPGHCQAARSGEAIEVPGTIEDALAARIDRLPAIAREVLHAASVFGVEVPRAVFAPTTGLSDADLNPVLDTLESARLLVGSISDLVFPHTIIHETVFRTMPAETRRIRFSRAIEAIEARWLNRLDEHLEHLARDAINGELWEKAANYGRRAGEKALNRAAMDEAIVHLEGALESMLRLPKSRETDERVIDVRLALPAAYRASGRFERMLAHLGQAEKLANALADNARLATVKIYEANVHNLQGRFDDAVAAGRRALELAELVGDPALTGGAYSALGQAYLFPCDNRRVIEVFSRYLVFVSNKMAPEQQSKSDAAAVFCLAHIAAARALLGEFDEAETRVEEACRIADAIGDLHVRALAHGVAGIIAVIQGDVDPAVSRLTLALEISDASHSRRLHPLLAAHLGYAYALAGRSANARSLIEEAIEEARREHSSYDEAWATAFLGYSCLIAEDLENARRYGESALEFARERNFRAVEMWVRRLLGTVCSIVTPPDPTLAEKTLGKALSLAEALDMRPDVAHCRFALGKHHLRAGRFDEAGRETDAAIELYRVMDMTFWLPQAEAVQIEVVKCAAR